jgi:hypothetical protein
MIHTNANMTVVYIYIWQKIVNFCKNKYFVNKIISENTVHNFIQHLFDFFAQAITIYWFNVKTDTIIKY